jgi:hypothetical protein
MRPVLRWLPAILILAILLIWCRRQQAALHEEIDELTRTDLLIEHSDAGEWIDFSNIWAVEECDGPNVTYRPGILFQFGLYRVNSSEVFTDVEIVLSSGRSASYGEGHWINIVADYPGRPAEPIDPDDAFALFPNDVFTPTCEEDLADGCLRNRLINAHLKSVSVLMTYWQGASGYRTSARQTKTSCSGNEFAFTFNDPFRIDVYRNDGDSMTHLQLFRSVDVESVRVNTALGSSDKNQTQPPPWEYP